MPVMAMMAGVIIHFHSYTQGPLCFIVYYMVFTQCQTNWLEINDFSGHHATE